MDTLAQELALLFRTTVASAGVAILGSHVIRGPVVSIHLWKLCRDPWPQEGHNLVTLRLPRA